MTERKRRLLVAYSYSCTYVATTRDYLEAFRLSSDWEVHYLHVTGSALIDFDFSSYDALFHNYCARLCFDGYVSASYIEAARQFEGIKILAVQDEYDFTDTLRQKAIQIGFDIFLTCVPQESLEYVYPRSMFPKTEFVSVLTGYVPDALVEHTASKTPLAQRPRKISYRGRDIGARYGLLGFEKLEIGRRMQALCSVRGFETDIASDEASRIYGDDWFHFLASCRATLGTESGSNVFDFDGEVLADYHKLTESLGRPPDYRAFEPRIRALEAKIDMGQVSPRLFEAAAMRTPMILFEGHYSGILQPGLHYLALKKDFSNIDTILEQLDDLSAMEAMTERAYTHLVASGRYSYRAFISEVMTCVQRYIAAKPARTPSSPFFKASDDNLSARVLAGDFRIERPTVAPLSTEWQEVDTALQKNAAISESWSRLLEWSRRELLGEKRPATGMKTAAIAALEQQRAAIDASFLAQLQTAYRANRVDQIDDAVQKSKKQNEALLEQLVGHVLAGRSRLAASLAILRAPWVEADVPSLKKAKRLRERAKSIRGARAALNLAKQITSTIKTR